jgi:hypothetical protein
MAVEQLPGKAVNPLLTPLLRQFVKAEQVDMARYGSALHSSGG